LTNYRDDKRRETNGEQRKNVLKDSSSHHAMSAFSSRMQCVLHVPHLSFVAIALQGAAGITTTISGRSQLQTQVHQDLSIFG
jgi:hypothetical protein